MAELRIGRSTTTLHAPDGLTKEEIKVRNTIYNRLSYRKDDFIFVPVFKSGQWDGYYRKYHRKVRTINGKRTFPGHGDFFSTGLLSRVIDSWSTVKGVDIVDCRDIPDITIDRTLDSFRELRPYQQEAVVALLLNSINGLPFPRGIEWLPPRTGKTRVAAAILDQIRSARPAVFVVERVDLARQTVLALGEVLDQEIGMVGDGECNIQDITVITIQSLHYAFRINYKPKKGEKVEATIKNYGAIQAMVTKCETLIIDEAHHVSSASYQTAIQKAGNAWCIFGLSGTPWMDDGSDLLLETAIGPVIFHKDYSYMVDNGYLCPLSVWFYSLPKLLCYGGSYQSIYKAAVVENLIKTYVIVQLANAAIKRGKSVAILTTQIKHTRDIAARIYGAVSITGKERGKERQRAYQRLAKKRIPCIVSNCFNEGIDVPSLDVAINADGGVDSRRIFQRLRIMTPAPGKKRGIYIDFMHAEKHLEKHSRRRLQFYKNEPAFDVVIKDKKKKLRKRFDGYVAMDWTD